MDFITNSRIVYVFTYHLSAVYVTEIGVATMVVCRVSNSWTFFLGFCFVLLIDLY